MLTASHFKYIPPAINFNRPEKKQLEKDKYMVAKLRSVPDQFDSQTYELNVPYFDAESPEVWLQFKDALHKVLVGQNIQTGPEMVQMARRLLQGNALAKFNATWD